MLKVLNCISQQLVPQQNVKHHVQQHVHGFKNNVPTVNMAARKYDTEYKIIKKIDTRPPTNAPSQECCGKLIVSDSTVVDINTTPETTILINVRPLEIDNCLGIESFLQLQHLVMYNGPTVKKVNTGNIQSKG